MHAGLLAKVLLPAACFGPCLSFVFCCYLPQQAFSLFPKKCPPCLPQTAKHFILFVFFIIKITIFPIFLLCRHKNAFFFARFSVSFTAFYFGKKPVLPALEKGALGFAPSAPPAVMLQKPYPFLLGSQSGALYHTALARQIFCRAFPRFLFANIPFKIEKRPFKVTVPPANFCLPYVRFAALSACPLFLLWHGAVFWFSGREPATCKTPRNRSGAGCF